MRDIDSALKCIDLEIEENPDNGKLKEQKADLLNQLSMFCDAKRCYLSALSKF